MYSAICALAFALGTACVAQTAPAAVTVRAPGGQLRLEVARTPAEREYGLMNRTSVPSGTGMIFVFDQDAPIQFWMKNTLVPLDMIFVAADGTVRSVYSDVPTVAPNLPDDKIPLWGGVAKFVIELSAGEAARDRIVAGVKLDMTVVPPAISKESP